MPVIVAETLNKTKENECGLSINVVISREFEYLVKKLVALIPL
jgi:hypothetical protein